MHSGYTQVPFSSHMHYHKPAHSVSQLMCMLFCSQRSNQNQKERKINLSTKFLTANLTLKILHPKQTPFFHSVDAPRSGIIFQGRISFCKCCKNAWHIQHHYHSIFFFAFFIVHYSQHLWEFIENKNSMLGCETAAWKNFFLIGRGTPFELFSIWRFAV